MSLPSLAEIHAARQRIAGQLHITPMLGSRTLTALTGVSSLSLKCESFQKTGSFKVRGALNAMVQLDAAQRARGVVTVSAGNHAQAVAWAGRSAGVNTTVVMPKTASRTKIAASEGYGAKVTLHGTGAEAFARAQEMATEEGLTFIHPFDAPNVIAGAASCGLEILEQSPDVEVVVVPIGGGGLIAGITSAIKQTRPDVTIFGVEPTGADSMYQSFRTGTPVRLPSPPVTVADGLASPLAGERCYAIIRDLVDDVVLVTDDEIMDAVSLLLTRVKILAEPAGAAATAALLTGKIPAASGKRVVALVSGGNVDLEKLRP